MIPINPYFLRMTAAVLLLLLAVACVTPVTAADTSGDDAKNYLIIYIIGSNLEAEYGEMSGLMQDMTANWDPNAGEMLIIYGGADKSGWDSGITITNASLLFSDLAKGCWNGLQQTSPHLKVCSRRSRLLRPTSRTAVLPMHTPISSSWTTAAVPPVTE